MLLMEKKNEFTVKRLMRRSNIIEVGKFKCSDIHCLFGDTAEEKSCLDIRGDMASSYYLSENSQKMCEIKYMMNMTFGNQEQAEKYYIALAIADEEYNETVRIFVDKNTDKYIYIFEDLANTYYLGSYMATCEDDDCCDIAYDAESGILLVKTKYWLSNCTREYREYLKKFLLEKTAKKYIESNSERVRGLKYKSFLTL